MVVGSWCLSCYICLLFLVTNTSLCHVWKSDWLFFTSFWIICYDRNNAHLIIHWTHNNTSFFFSIGPLMLFLIGKYLNPSDFRNKMIHLFKFKLFFQMPFVSQLLDTVTPYLPSLDYKSFVLIRIFRVPVMMTPWTIMRLKPRQRCQF